MCPLFLAFYIGETEYINTIEVASFAALQWPPPSTGPDWPKKIWQENIARKYVKKILQENIGK